MEDPEAVIEDHLARAAEDVAGAMLDDTWPGWDSPLGTADNPRPSQAAAPYSAVHVAAAGIADRCASTGWDLLDLRGEEVSEGAAGDARALLLEPNGWTDWHDLVYVTVLDLREGRAGEAYWLLDDGTDDGRSPETALPVRIFRWLPGDVKPVRSGRQLIGYGVRKRQNGGAVWEPWLAHEVVYFRRPSRFDDLRGFGLTAGITSDIRGAQSREQLATEHAENGAPVRQFIEMPEGLDVDDWGKYVRKFRDMHSGVGNRFRTHFLLPGAKPHAANEPVFSPGLVEVAKMDRRNVLADMGMPESILTGEMADYKLTEVVRNQERAVIGPQLGLLKRAIDRQLLRRAGLQLAWQMESTYTQLERLQGAEVRAKVGGVSIDELRVMAGDPPINEPWSQAIRDASGQVIAEREVPDTVQRASGPPSAERWFRTQAADIDRLATAVAPRVAAVFDRHLARAQAAIGGTVVRRADDDARIARALAALDIPGLNDEVGEVVGKAHRAAAEAGFDAAEQAAPAKVRTRNVKVSASFTQAEPDIGKVLRSVRTRPNGVKGVGINAHRQINKTLREGVAAGESPAKLRARVMAVRKSYKAWEADRIARTEVAVAYVQAANLRYRSLGVEHVVILDGRGGDTDIECAARDGKRVTLDAWEAENLLHPNCTAAAAPVV